MSFLCHIVVFPWGLIKGRHRMDDMVRWLRRNILNLKYATNFNLDEHEIHWNRNRIEIVNNFQWFYAYLYEIIFHHVKYKIENNKYKHCNSRFQYLYVDCNTQMNKILRKICLKRSGYWFDIHKSNKVYHEISYNVIWNQYYVNKSHTIQN